jgi:hypothetical protein
MIPRFRETMRDLTLATGILASAEGNAQDTTTTAEAHEQSTTIAPELYMKIDDDFVRVTYNSETGQYVPITTENTAASTEPVTASSTPTRERRYPLLDGPYVPQTREVTTNTTPEADEQITMSETTNTLWSRIIDRTTIPELESGDASVLYAIAQITQYDREHNRLNNDIEQINLLTRSLLQGETIAIRTSVLEMYLYSTRLGETSVSRNGSRDEMRIVSLDTEHARYEPISPTLQTATAANQHSESLAITEAMKEITRQASIFPFDSTHNTNIAYYRNVTDLSPITRLEQVDETYQVSIHIDTIEVTAQENGTYTCTVSYSQVRRENTYRLLDK